MTVIYKGYPKTSIIEFNFDEKATKDDINNVIPKV